MPENNQASDKTKPEATGSSSTQPGSQAIDMNHTNVIVPHRISNHDKLVQTMVMVDGEWVNVNDTNDQKNVQEDMHKVNRVVTEAQKDIINAQNAADSAVKSADSAISASKVNSDAIAAQGEAISEAKIALDSAAAKIRADVAKVQSEVNTAKTANETEAKSIRDDLKMANSSIATVKDHLGNVSSELDTYAKSAAAQEHDITIIRQKQGQFEVDYAGTKGDVNQIKANIKGLSENLKNSEGDVASLQVTAKKLQSSMSDAEGNISNLQVTAKSYDKIFEDHLGRISKVEQTASELTNEFADQQGHLNRVEQTAQGTQQTVANQQGQINSIQTDAAGIHQTLTGQGNQIANINVTLNGLNSKYEGVSGDLGKLKNSAMQNRGTVNAPDFNTLTQAGYYTVTNPIRGKNYPIGSWGTLEVSGQFSDINGRLNQKYVGDNGVVTYTRQYNANTKSWTAWIKAANQNDVTTLSNRITTNSTQITQNKQAIALKADQSTVNNLSGEVSQNKAQLQIQAGQISSKVTSTDVNNIINGKGYATTSTVQSLITQKAGTINESIANLTSKVNSNVTQVQSLTASIDGLQSTVASKADRSQITQLSNVIQSKVSTSDFTTKVSQLSTDINARVTKGDLLSQINVEAGRTLIQSNKIYFDADSFVMSPNSKAFIPSAFITNLSADKITTGTLDASKLHVKNFSANDIEAGTLSGVTIKAGDTDFFQTSQDNIYWITNNGSQSALIGRGEYVTFPGLNIFDSHAIYLGTWAGADLENGTIKDTGGSLGHPKFSIELPADSAFDLLSKNGEMGSTMVPLDNSRISGWVDQHEFFYLKQTQGFHTELNPDLNTSQFRIQKNDHIGAYFGEGNNGNQITFNFGGNDGGLNVNGPLHVTGSKNSIVETRQGYLAINAYETAEYYFGDIGENNTGDTSQVVIGIDRIFNEVVNTDIQYQVFVTPYSNAHVWVEKRYNNRFIVKSDRPNAEFGWELKAKRKGYESNRLRRVNVDFNQMDLKGEN